MELVAVNLVRFDNRREKLTEKSAAEAQLVIWNEVLHFLSMCRYHGSCY